MALVMEDLHEDAMDPGDIYGIDPFLFMYENLQRGLGVNQVMPRLMNALCLEGQYLKGTVAGTVAGTFATDRTIFDEVISEYSNGTYASTLEREQWELERLAMLEEMLGKITPQSLRTFIHANNSSASELLRLLQFFADLLSVVNSSNLSESAVFKNLKYCIHQAVYQIVLEKRLAHFLSSATVVLFLFEYLMGYIERGGWATYSDTSWEFRATYVSIELRLAAYFWIKFRARAGRGIPSVSPNKRNKFEPRLKAKLRPGENARDVWLGEYDTFEEAADVYWIGAYYYERRDRFSDERRSWCLSIDLPPLPVHQSEEDKISWVRLQAKNYLTRRSRDQGAVAVEQYQVAGRAVPVISGTGGGSQTPAGASQPASSPRTSLPESSNFFIGTPLDEVVLNDELMSFLAELEGQVATPEDDLHPAGLIGIGQGQHCEDLSVYDYCEDQGAASHQQDVQHFQQIHASAIVSEGRGPVAEVGAMRQDETEDRSVPRSSSNQHQAMDLPSVPQKLEELKLTKSMRSLFQELQEGGWDFELQPLDSIDCSVSFLNCEGRKRRKLTRDNILAIEDIHEQGYKIILEPLSNATPKDANGRPQSRSGSRDLCSSCNARLSVE